MSSIDVLTRLLNRLISNIPDPVPEPQFQPETSEEIALNYCLRMRNNIDITIRAIMN